MGAMNMIPVVMEESCIDISMWIGDIHKMSPAVDFSEHGAAGVRRRELSKDYNENERTDASTQSNITEDLSK